MQSAAYKTLCVFAGPLPVLSLNPLISPPVYSTFYFEVCFVLTNGIAKGVSA